MRRGRAESGGLGGLGRSLVLAGQRWCVVVVVVVVVVEDRTGQDI